MIRRYQNISCWSSSRCQVYEFSDASCTPASHPKGLALVTTSCWDSERPATTKFDAVCSLGVAPVAHTERSCSCFFFKPTVFGAHTVAQNDTCALSPPDWTSFLKKYCGLPVACELWCPLMGISPAVKRRKSSDEIFSYIGNCFFLSLLDATIWETNLELHNMLSHYSHYYLPRFSPNISGLSIGAVDFPADVAAGSSMDDMSKSCCGHPFGTFSAGMDVPSPKSGRTSTQH